MTPDVVTVLESLCNSIEALARRVEALEKSICLSCLKCTDDDTDPFAPPVRNMYFD